MSQITNILNLLNSLLDLLKMIPILGEALKWSTHRIRTLFNPTEKTFKFRNEKIRFLVTKKVMSNEANLPNTSDMVVVRAEQPLELIDFNFAKRVYKNMRHKNINYQYFFCYEDRTKKTIEKVVKMLRNISLVYGFHHEDIKAEKKYDEVINELINSLNNTFISNERKSLILNNQDIYGRNFRIPEVIANNLQGIIKNKISIYFIPRKASETFCIHQGINKKECYLRWGDKDYFINLPRSEVDRKLNAYKYDKEILEKQGIFYIHPESFNDIRQYFLEEIRDNFPDNIQRCFEDICLGKSNN